ncbi:type IV secretory system conjugative DNA transfer family protein [Candidatus Saccharibacteria bacterium]|nr:type IV secretory system conjugative DNA transfer family protein [Candidatus Saccharibacteria bacterium]
MTAILTFFGILLGIMLVASPVIFLQIRRILREQKNFERGLKMVPLLIHLPPPSDDTEVGSRDVRDVLDENISKAQILYNIISSTLQKGLKSRFYGQRHITFEIVGSKGFVHFYAAVPVALIDVVKQAIVSAYPAARLEEVAEHNIFSPIGKISGTIGGELTLKEHYAYPIATYQDLKRDAMQSLLNSLSTLEKEDGAGIQFLLRPANPEWRKIASGISAKKRKGKESKKGPDKFFSWTQQLFTAFTKPLEDKSEGGGDKSNLSSLDQAVLDSIDDKTRSPGYEVLIRIVASSNISQRAQAILSNIVATFALFDAQGKNGFKYTPAKDIEKFVTAYILRFFPQENNQNILNSVELATLFHFPDQDNIPTSQLERQNSKQVDGPRNIPEEGFLLGYNLFRGVKKPIRINLEDRRRHMYVVGQTGTGKSTFLENLAIQDMLNGEGFAFVDPHGDVAERLLAMVPRERTEDVVYFAPGDMNYPMGLNLFEFDSPEQKDFLIQEAINMLYKLYDPQHQGIIGPRYEHWFRNAALTLMSDPGGSTFIDIPKVFTDNKYAKQKLKFVTDQTVLDFWNKEMAQTSDYHKSEVLGWFVSKFGAFLSNEMMRNIIGQTKSAFDLRDIMDNKKILIVNLSKGRTGELNSKLLGMIFVMKFQAAAMSRANIDENKRVDFSLYVDEFQNFSTDSFATIMSEARKYHLNLIVANQFTTQLTEEIRDAVFGNMGTIVSFRVGQNDVETLSRYFQPLFEADDLLRVPNFNAIVRTLVNGVPTQSFSMATMPALGRPNAQLAVALKQLSAAKFGRPRAKVETEIFARLTTIGEPKPSFDSHPLPPTRPRTMPPVKYPASGSSFLDEWLAKKRSKNVQKTNKPISSVPPPLTPKQPQQQPAGQNISSSELQSKEITHIADELRQSLQKSEKNEKPKEDLVKQSSEAQLLVDDTNDKPEEKDTIYIDQEGNIHNTDSK